MASIPEPELFRILQNENCVCTNESCVSAIALRERTALDDRVNYPNQALFLARALPNWRTEAVMIDIFFEDLEVL